MQELIHNKDVTNLQLFLQTLAEESVKETFKLGKPHSLLAESIFTNRSDLVEILIQYGMNPQVVDTDNNAFDAMDWSILDLKNTIRDLKNALSLAQKPTSGCVIL